MKSKAPKNSKKVGVLLKELFAKPQICQDTQDYLSQFSDYDSIWNDILAKNDAVIAYGWVHTATGATDRIIKCLIELYENWSAYFSPQVAKWFVAVKRGDTSTIKEMNDFLDAKNPKIDKFFAMGFVKILSRDYGDTGNCVACLGQVILAINRGSNQEKATEKAKKLAIKILVKEFPNVN